VATTLTAVATLATRRSVADPFRHSNGRRSRRSADLPGPMTAGQYRPLFREHRRGASLDLNPPSW
jgi:hypothetical protein